MHVSINLSIYIYVHIYTSIHLTNNLSIYLICYISLFERNSTEYILKLEFYSNLTKYIELKQDILLKKIRKW